MQLLPGRHAGRAGISAGLARASPRMGREGGAEPRLPAAPWGFWQLREHVRCRLAFPRASPSPSPRGRLAALGKHRDPPRCVHHRRAIAVPYHPFLSRAAPKPNPPASPSREVPWEQDGGWQHRGGPKYGTSTLGGSQFPIPDPSPSARRVPPRTSTRKPNLGGGTPTVTPSAGRFGDSRAIGRGVPTQHAWPRRAARALAAPAQRCRGGDRQLYLLLGVLITIAKPLERRSCGCQDVCKVPSRARGDAGWGPNLPCAGERDASHGAGIPAAPGSVFTTEVKTLGTWGTTTIISYLLSQQKCWYLQPAQLPVLPVLLILVFARGGECLEAAPAAPARGPARMEWDDQPHIRDSPGPFQVSSSCGFSPGSGFSGSFGLSRASLDSAAGEGRQQVMCREFQRQHPTGVRTSGP